MHKVRRVWLCVIFAVSTVTLSAVNLAAVPPNTTRRVQDRPAYALAPAGLKAWRKRPGLAAQSVGFDASGVTLLSQIEVSEFPSNSAEALDVWGYVSPSGREYGIVGLSKGTGFVDLSDPSSPVIVADIGDASSGWSDMAVYGEYCYNVNESSGGMQVIDLTRIDEGIVTLAPANPNEFSRAHNIYVNEESGYAYPCGTNAVSGFIAYDLTDPADPQTDPSWTWNTTYIHDLHVVSYSDCPYDGGDGECEIAFAFCAGAGLWIIDVTDKSSMSTISSLLYPNVSYCHQGWLSEDRHYLFIDDEGDEFSYGIPSTTYVIDVHDLANPQYVTSHTNEVVAVDHNLMVRGDYIFAANYTSGLRVFDVSDPLNGFEVGYFDTSPHTGLGYRGAWGVFSQLPSGIVLVSDIAEGLFVLDVTETTGCLTDSHCNDLNPCTTDVCDAGGDCVHAPTSIGTACDDGQNCTINDQCDGGGTCVSTDVSTIACVDDTPCEPNTCDTDKGLCVCLPCVAAASPIEEELLTPKSRFLSFTPTNSGDGTALQVVFGSLPPPFDVFDGLQMWVGKPQEVSENGASVDPIVGFPNFKVSSLQCEPFLMDWGSVGPLQVYHPAIVPVGEYLVRAISEGCLDAGAATFSQSLTVTTARSGDTVGNCSMVPCSPPDGVVNIVDVTAILGRFVSDPDSIVKARADMEPAWPDLVINISDVMIALNGFVGLPYPFAPGPPPPPCP